MAAQVDFDVVRAPSWWTMHRRWAIVLSLLLLVVLIAVLIWTRVRAAERARAADTAELTATLLRGGLPDGPPIPSDGGEVFALAVSGGDVARLLHADVAPAGMPVIVRRAGHGVSVAVGEEEPQRRMFGEPIALGDGLAVKIDCGAIEVPSPPDHVVDPEIKKMTNEPAPLTGRWR